jgi:hypothetical protein
MIANRVIPTLSAAEGEGSVWAGGAQNVLVRAPNPHRSLATLGMTLRG